MSKLNELHNEFERVFERLRTKNPRANEHELVAIFRDAIRREPDLADTAVEAWIELHGPIRKH